MHKLRRAPTGIVIVVLFIVLGSCTSTVPRGQLSANEAVFFISGDALYEYTPDAGASRRFQANKGVQIAGLACGPDGTVLYHESVVLPELQGVETHIVQYDPLSGKSVTLLEDHGDSPTFPALSPDESSLAVVTRGSGTFGIKFYRIDSMKEIAAYPAPLVHLKVSWVPGSSAVLLTVRSRPDDQPQIAMLDIPDGSRRNIGNGVMAIMSPDSKFMAYSDKEYHLVVEEFRNHSLWTASKVLVRDMDWIDDMRIMVSYATGLYKDSIGILDVTHREMAEAVPSVGGEINGFCFRSAPTMH